MRHTLFSARVAVVLAAVLAAAAGGCGDGPKNKVVPVEGKLTFADGKALPAGTRLRFDPQDGTAKTATGVTEADGSFKVTHLSGTTGAEVGKYTVVLMPPEGYSGDFTTVVPEKYITFGQFNAEVKEGMTPLDFKVETGKKR